MTDWELLQAYAQSRDEAAFAELAARHLDLVYSAALRQVRSAELAEEVAQSVFTDLARSIQKLQPGMILTAWLYQVTRRTAIDFIRRESRRQERERLAVSDMNPHTEPWTAIEPVLDEAMESLDSTDRAAILLRYFENKPLREVGRALGTSEDAAQKRVSRAVERLREFFAGKGVRTESASLMALISARAIQTAPSTIKTALLAAPATAITKTVAMTTMQKTCIVAAFAAAVGTACYEAQHAAAIENKLAELARPSVPAATGNEPLKQELDEANRKLALLESENQRLQSNTADLLRLRGEVSVLRAEEKDPTAAAAQAWLARVNQLKARLDQSPNAKIPEMQYLTQQDWLNAARRELDSDDDFRKAFSQLRSAAENTFVSTFLKPALAQFIAANGSFPTALSQLQQYFASPVDDSILQRWEITPKSTVPSIGVGDMIITETAPVDSDNDGRIAVGEHGYGNAGPYAWAPDTTTILAPVLQAYEAANNGAEPNDPSQLQPFITNSAQQAALQKLLRIGGTSASSQRN